MPLEQPKSKLEAVLQQKHAVKGTLQNTEVDHTKEADAAYNPLVPPYLFAKPLIPVPEHVLAEEVRKKMPKFSFLILI